MDADRRMRDSRISAAGAFLAALGAALGAFGAHAMKARLGPAALGWWETAVQYQMWHAVALVALGAFGGGRMRRPAWLLATGTIAFSGSLYIMALTEARWLGAVTPVGGVLMISGWLLAAWRLIRVAPAG
jgi:uncharacterized membrane protein YgdD (TMEM256/DUF423 family)